MERHLENLRGIGEYCWIRWEELVGSGEWLEEYERVYKEGKVSMLLGKGVEGVSDSVMEEVGKYVLIGKLVAEKDLFYRELMDGFGSPTFPPP